MEQFTGAPFAMLLIIDVRAQQKLQPPLVLEDCWLRGHMTRRLLLRDVRVCKILQQGRACVITDVVQLCIIHHRPYLLERASVF